MVDMTGEAVNDIQSVDKLNVIDVRKRIETKSIFRHDS